MSDGDTKVAFFDEVAFRLFGRLIARQFVVFGGVSGALETGKKLLKDGIVPTYNRIDEHVRSRERVHQVLASYITLLEEMGPDDRGSIAIKPSALGIAFGQFFFTRMLERLIERAAGKCVEIEVDAETRETLVPVTSVLSTLAKRLPEGVILRPAFQMHLPDDLRRKLIDECGILEMPLRIVKGSGLYNTAEAECSREEVLARYHETFLLQIVDGMFPKVATVRDKELIRAIAEFTREEHVSAERFSFQFLHGPFGRSIMKKLAHKGYRVGCYVPFVEVSAPDEWKGYVRRRIAFGRKLLFGG